MALHLHVLCQSLPDGGWLNNKPAGRGLYRSGVWKLSDADAGKPFDYIWLHESTKKKAGFGGKVLLPLLAADPSHLTAPDESLSFERRFTVPFDMSERFFLSEDIRFRGTLIFNSYAVAEWDF